MKNLFIPHELAVIAKEKGFDEPCITKFEQYFDKRKLQPVLATLSLNTPYEHEYNGYDQKIINDQETRWFFTGYRNSVKDHNNDVISAPLYQQIIDWLRDKKRIGIVQEFKKCPLGKTGFRIYSGVDSDKFAQGKTYYEALNEAIKQAFKLI